MKKGIATLIVMIIMINYVLYKIRNQNIINLKNHNNQSQKSCLRLFTQPQVFKEGEIGIFVNPVSPFFMVKISFELGILSLNANLSSNILFNLKIKPTMNVVRTLLVNKTKAEIEDFALKYFRFNGYYNLTVKKGMKFSTYSSRSEPLSPKRLNRDILINFFDNPQGGQKVVVEFSTLKMGGYGPKTAIDKEYYEDFMKHFDKALKAGSVEKFEDESYVKRAKVYTKPFYIISIAFLLIFITARYFLGDILDAGLMLAVFFAAQSLAIWYGNRQIEKDAKAV